MPKMSRLAANWSCELPTSVQCDTKSASSDSADDLPHRGADVYDAVTAVQSTSNHAWHCPPHVVAVNNRIRHSPLTAHALAVQEFCQTASPTAQAVFMQPSDIRQASTIIASQHQECAAPIAQNGMTASQGATEYAAQTVYYQIGNSSCPVSPAVSYRRSDSPCPASPAVSYRMGDGPCPVSPAVSYRMGDGPCPPTPTLSYRAPDGVSCPPPTLSSRTACSATPGAGNDLERPGVDPASRLASWSAPQHGAQLDSNRYPQETHVPTCSIPCTNQGYQNHEMYPDNTNARIEPTNAHVSTAAHYSPRNSSVPNTTLNAFHPRRHASDVACHPHAPRAPHSTSPLPSSRVSVEETRPSLFSPRTRAQRMEWCVRRQKDSDTRARKVIFTKGTLRSRAHEVVASLDDEDALALYAALQRRLNVKGEDTKQGSAAPSVNARKGPSTRSSKSIVPKSKDVRKKDPVPIEPQPRMKNTDTEKENDSAACNPQLAVARSSHNRFAQFRSAFREEERDTWQPAEIERMKKAFATAKEKQRVAEEKQKIAEEKQKLAEEKRTTVNSLNTADAQTRDTARESDREPVRDPEYRWTSVQPDDTGDRDAVDALTEMRAVHEKFAKSRNRVFEKWEK